MHAIYILLYIGYDTTLEDHQGNNAITSVQHMLAKGLFTEATILAHLLLLAKCNVNHVNMQDRTLLSYSVSKGDLSAPLTRMLLNFGAKVWPADHVHPSDCDVIEMIHRERERSTFTWFLRALMEQKIGMSDVNETIYLLGTAMGEEPNFMRKHVTRTMLQLGQYFNAMGPLFHEVKQRLAPYWTRPQPLKFLCLKQVRHLIGPKNMSDAQHLSNLEVPQSILQFLQLF